MQLALAIGGAGAASWGVSAGMLLPEYMGMSTVGLGFSLGSMLGGALFGPKMPDTQGPRLSDKSVQGSGYGQFIPITYGSMRLAGNMIWATDLVEVSDEESVGGKGGGGGTYTSYTYFANFALMICEGEINGVRKIWADGKLIYNTSEDNEGYTGATGNIRVYNGTEDQLPDPYIEGIEGVGNTPAYRGRAYAVFEMLPLQTYGNRIPNITFEVVRGNAGMPNAVFKTVNAGTASKFSGKNAVDKYSSRYWYCDVVNVGGTDFNYLKCVNYDTQTLIYEHYFPITTGTWPNKFVDDVSLFSNASSIAYIQDTNEIWIAGSTLSAEFWVHDADTGARKFTGTRVANTSTIYISYDENTKSIVFHASSGTSARVYDLDTRLERTTAALTIQGTAAYTQISFSTIILLILPNGEIIASSYMCASGHPNYSDSYVYDMSSLTLVGKVKHNDVCRGNLYDKKRDVFAFIVDSSTSGFFEIQVVDALSLQTIKTATISNYGINFSNPCFIYHEALDLYIVFDSVTGNTNVSYINPDSLTIEYSYLYGNGFDVPANTTIGISNYGLSETNSSHLLAAGTSNGFSLVPTQPRLYANSAILSDIVTDISTRAGLDVSDIDVSAMSEEVHGYLITKQSSARSALEPLMLAYFYDAVESE